MVFADRDDAGRRLAARLGHLRGKPVVVLGLPRGGVPVAFQVARALSAPLDVIVVRKLGVPFQPELAMGAVGEGGARVINQEIVREARVSDDELAAVQRREQAEVEARAARCRAWWPRQPLDGRVAVVVDDGIATGSTARARIGGDADELVCVSTPLRFFAIGQFYVSFPQVSDDEVSACLRRAVPAQARTPQAADNADPPVRDEEVRPEAGLIRLAGYLTVPDNAPGSWSSPTAAAAAGTAPATGMSLAS